ncbi:MAG: hypothetical protein J2P57_15545 [Acidimicrobiaceae bacterium]|nr:hypothetical protein [Acidimicrobiaceae bacterium]
MGLPRRPPHPWRCVDLDEVYLELYSAKVIVEPDEVDDFEGKFRANMAEPARYSFGKRLWSEALKEDNRRPVDTDDPPPYVRPEHAVLLRPVFGSSPVRKRRREAALLASQQVRRPRDPSGESIYMAYRT